MTTAMAGVGIEDLDPKLAALENMREAKVDLKKFSTINALRPHRNDRTLRSAHDCHPMEISASCE
jgi:hypothetical protein